MSGSALSDLAPISDGVENTPLGPSAPTNASHHSHGSAMIIGSSIAIVLVLFITSARIGARRFRSRALGADDVVMVPAAIGCIMYLALNIASESGGCLGQHLDVCSYVEIEKFIKLSRANLPMFYFTVFCVKISITLANLRITGLTSMKWLYTHWAYLAILACLMPVSVFLTTFSCSPTATLLSPQYTGTMSDPRTAICLDEGAVGLFTRISHIVTDWFLLPIPLIIIRRLQMPLVRKIRLMFVFCIGLISTVASIVRIIRSERVTADLTYDYYELYTWDVVDISFATIVASLPPLNGVFDLALLRLKSWGSETATRLMTKFRSSSFSSGIGIGSRSGASPTYNDNTRLSSKESNEAMTPADTDDGRRFSFSFDFHQYSYRDPTSSPHRAENIERGVLPHVYTFEADFHHHHHHSHSYRDPAASSSPHREEEENIEHEVLPHVYTLEPNSLPPAAREALS